MNPGFYFSRGLPMAAAMLALATLSGCVTPVPVTQTTYPYQPSAYDAPPPGYGQGSYVEYGTIANIDVVQSQTAGVAPSGAGAVAGGLIGGALGNQVGGGNGRAAATVLGVVGGALLGNAVEAGNGAPRAYQSYRISVQTDNGAYRSFDVPSPGDLRVGDRVRIDGGRISRM